MALLIPENPFYFNQSLGEEEVFDSLKSLDDNYYVFHSLKWINTTENAKHNLQGEADFLVLHLVRGIIVFEIKSGIIRLENRTWYQTNRNTGVEKEIYDPAEQANRTKFFLIDILNNKLKKKEICMVYHAVWFPSVLFAIENLPPNYSSDMILDRSSLENPQKSIEKIYDFWESKFPIRRKPKNFKISKTLNIICPNFCVVPSFSANFELREKKFIQLTNQQKNILEFLDEQETAVISGSAGTGKTLVALEKARRHSDDGESVLFLCYNSALKKYLSKFYPIKRVHFQNFHSLAATYITDYDSIDELSEKFVNLLLNDEFKLSFNHFIVDEGQDFEDDWIEALEIKVNKSLYVFYDKNQLIYQKDIPKWIKNAECKLTLKKNCRNTLQIARTSYRCAGIDIKPSNILIKGPRTKLYFYKQYEDKVKYIKKLINGFLLEKKLFPQDITILTLETVENSVLKELKEICGVKISSDLENDFICFTTVRKFKGLESKVIILTDVILSNFENVGFPLRFYVGASRARHELHILIYNSEENEFSAAINALAPSRNLKASEKSFAKLLDAEWVKEV